MRLKFGEEKRGPLKIKSKSKSIDLADAARGTSDDADDVLGLAHPGGS